MIRRTSPVIRTESLSRVFSSGANRVQALRDVDLTVESGEMISVVGSSGSGKSTLMNLLGCLDRATSGSYWLDGTEVSSLERNSRQPFATGKSASFSRDSTCCPGQRPWPMSRCPSCTAGATFLNCPGRRRKTRSREWGWRTGYTSCRTSCPAGSNRGWPLPGPW